MQTNVTPPPSILGCNSCHPVQTFCHRVFITGSGAKPTDRICSPSPRNKCGVTSTNGFTLIELSIVLVIIGLIVGGVLVGRDLINAAKLRSVITDIEKFNTAANTFRTKYNCIPGDCANATDFFGQFVNCDQWSASPDLSTTTCNGDGNGRIALATPATNWWQHDETMLFWQHLSRAGLVGGNYSGIMGRNGIFIDLTNVPFSRLENGCYSIDSSLTGGESDYAPYTKMRGSFISLGNSVAGENGAYLQRCTDSIYSLSAISAKNIDDKMDDGRPFTGAVQTTADRYSGNYNSAYYGTVGAPPGCTDVGGVVPYADVVYATSAAETGCQLFFKSAF